MPDRGPVHEAVARADDFIRRVNRRAGFPDISGFTGLRALVFDDPEARTRLKQEYPRAIRWATDLLRKPGLLAVPGTAVRALSDEVSENLAPAARARLRAVGERAQSRIVGAARDVSARLLP